MTHQKLTANSGIGCFRQVKPYTQAPCRYPLDYSRFIADIERMADSVVLPLHTIGLGKPTPHRLAAERFDDTHFTHRVGLHRHSFFELLYLAHGDGVHVLNGSEIPVKPGDLYLIAPGEPHDVRGIVGAQGWAIIFEADALGLHDARTRVNLPGELLLLSFLRPTGTAHGHFAVVPENRARWNDRLEALHDELHNQELGFLDAARWQLNVLLLDAARLAHDRLGGVAAHVRPLLERVFGVIEARFREPISSRDVAAEVGLSPSHLTYAVRRASGRTVLEWIHERRLTEARRILLESTDPIERIAEAAGYTDAAYFTRRFRAAHGLTPKAWRQAHRPR